MMARPMWVFGYGSLMWNPEFEVAERAPGVLAGYRRAFCMRSVHLRGTASAPGLVLALDAEAGAACHGVALRVAEGREEETLVALRARELQQSAYVEREVPISLADGRDITALTYIVQPDHELYCGHMPLEEQARIIAQSAGERGPNREYLWNTVLHLAELGIEDADLDWLATRVREIAA